MTAPVGPALALAADLQAIVAPLQLTMSAPILAFGIAQFLWGPAADRLGRRPVLFVGLGLDRTLDASVSPFAIGIAVASGSTALVAWTVVRRHGERRHA